MRIYEREEDLKPGESVSIKFGTRGKVTILDIAYLDGYCRRAEWVFEDAGDAPKDFDTGFRPKRFKVIGPVPKPKNSIGMIEKIIEITKEAYSLGWISKEDVYQGLMDKLGAAKENIDKGFLFYHTAKNIMNAFKNLLDAQRGKAIDESTYNMLYYNADMLIGML